MSITSKRRPSITRRRPQPPAPVQDRAGRETAQPGRCGAGAMASTRCHREQVPLEDQALYTCSCGFVFHAQVSTSVGCPHCGDTQAW